MVTALVTGAGGMIGGHLVRRLNDEGFAVRAVDCKPFEQWHQLQADTENCVADLRFLDRCRTQVDGIDYVYNLAADMGGMGFIESHKADCMLSVLISTNMLLAAQQAGVRRFFYSSSACVYPGIRQSEPNAVSLREEDVYPADCEDGYGWEKLFSERMARHFYEDYGMETRVARYHNVYGPHGAYTGGREKAPAAIARKAAEAVLGGRHEITIWGDGEQTRSFMFIDDCVEGTRRLMDSDHRDPLNIGSNELVTINQLVRVVEDLIGVRLERRYDLSAPQGVRGRNSNNSRIRAVLGWEPSVRLHDGMRELYAWVFHQLAHPGCDKGVDCPEGWNAKAPFV